MRFMVLRTCWTVRLPIVPIISYLRLKSQTTADCRVWGNFTCPTCNYTGSFYVKDILLDNKKDVRIVSWRPQDILIESGSLDKNSCIYHYRPNSDDIANARTGAKLTLTTFPMELLYAIKKNATFKFNDGVLHHARERTISGVKSYGWGIPRPLSHFQLVWALACLYKINEALSIDYAIPKRVITPAPRSGAADGLTADPAGTIDMMPYMHHLMRMWTSDDPGEVTFVPFPIQYMLLGGEANQLVPDKTILMAEDALLHALDIPADIYRSSLSTEAAPIALTIFENRWRPLRWELNQFLDWLCSQLASPFGWSPVLLSLLPLKLNADLGRQTLYAQLAAQKTISWSTALQVSGINYLDECRRIMDEDSKLAEMQKENEDRLQALGNSANITQSQNPESVGLPPAQDQAAGAPPAVAGAPGGGGGGAAPSVGSPAAMQQAAMMTMSGQSAVQDWQSMTPVDMMQYVQTLASQVVMMDPSSRRSKLNELRNQMPESLYGSLTDQLRKLDYQYKQQGGQMMKQHGMVVQ